MQNNSITSNITNNLYWYFKAEETICVVVYAQHATDLKKKNILYEYTYTTRAELPSKMIPHTFKSIFLLTHSKRVSWAQVTASMSRRYYINNITNLLIWVLLLLTSNFIVNNVAAIRKTFEFITHILYLLRSLFIYIYIRTVII